MGYGDQVPVADLVAWAQWAAEKHVAPLGRRWTHVQRVAAKAELVGAMFPAHRGTLVAAAWLHDVGYSPELAQSGFHPLDGGRFVRAHGQEQVARLVAHHTGARVEASLRGIDGYLDEFPFEDTELDRALTFCDLTTGPAGASVRVEERVAEIRERYGESHPVSECMKICREEFLAIEQDLGRRLATLAAGDDAGGTDC